MILVSEFIASKSASLMLSTCADEDEDDCFAFFFLLILPVILVRSTCPGIRTTLQA